MNLDLTTVKDISIVVAGIATLAGFLTALMEYSRQSYGRKAQHFVDLRRRFLETVSFQVILQHIADDSPELANVPIHDRRNFIGFLEEVQIMVDSRLIRPEVAHIMFGRYVKLADASQYLWSELDRTDPYWAIFRRLAAQQSKWEASIDGSKPVRF